MPSDKTNYTIQVVVILSIFFFVLFNLIFKLVIDYRTDSIKKKAEVVAAEKAEKTFLASMESQYSELIKLYQAREYEKVIEIIKVFNQYDKADYKKLPQIKKEIRLFYLKKKLEFIPKIQLTDYIQLTEDIDIQEDDSTEVFIRRPRYGQFFYTSDLPITLEGIALSIKGDFSDTIVWESSVDGAIGQGKIIQAHLTIGTHLITATGTNGETVGKMFTQIRIENKPDFLQQYQ